MSSEFALLLALCMATVVWPETSLPLQTASSPQRVIQLSVLCTFSASHMLAVCVAVGVCVYVCTHARVIIFYPPSSSLTGFPRLWPGERGSQGRNQTAEQWRASST